MEGENDEVSIVRRANQDALRKLVEPDEETTKNPTSDHKGGVCAVDTLGER